MKEATDQNITLTNIKQHEEALKQLEKDCKKRGELKAKCKDKKYGHIYNKKGICINCGVKDETRNTKITT